MPDPYNHQQWHLDLAGNYWGTDDPQEIADWIWDGNATSAISLFMDFEPFYSSPVVGAWQPEAVICGLFSPCPNPFNPTTRIPFLLSRDGSVRLTIFDVRGREVSVLLDSYLQAGPGFAPRDGRDRSGAAVSSEVYVGRLRTAEGVQIRMLVLAR